MVTLDRITLEQIPSQFKDKVKELLDNKEE